MTPPIIYNLFPRLVGPTTRWPEHALRARELAFNWIYLNPWHYPGFSGSLYAVKEPGRLNPLFLPPGSDPASLQPLRDFLQQMREARIPVMMDLVVNHTAKDSPLIEEHPDWFVRDGSGQVVSPSVTDPDDPLKVTVWGDLAEVDNSDSPDRERLWKYWETLVRDALELGFSGFRCDAAYMVPPELWRRLIEHARQIDTGVVFFAETLGAPLGDVMALREAGFDYFFNSSKWWDFREAWALEQHEALRTIAPSISFPETHDTTRLAADTGGDEAVQRQRYAFAAAFSAGVMMPIGYEFGFRRRMNVVETMPSHWERRAFDLSNFVQRVNRLKLSSVLLHGEGQLRALGDAAAGVLVLRREAESRVGWVLVNTDAEGEREVELSALLAEAPGLRLHRVCRDDAPGGGAEPSPRLTLDRAEVAYLLPA